MKSSNKYRLILGSKSPRRKELLKWLNIPFDIIVSNVLESSNHSVPDLIAKDIASQKGISVLNDLLKQKKSTIPLVLASDTIVCIDNTILGKPKNINEAKEMLLKLSDKTHKVITAVWIGTVEKNGIDIKEKVFSSQTTVHFTKIDQDLLNNYLSTNDSLDKAGAYGIQGQALTFIRSINGSYSNVVGFPLNDIIFHLKSFLGHENDTTGAWRKSFVSTTDSNPLS